MTDFTLDTSGARPITAKQALAALDRYVECERRGDVADHRGSCAGGSITADRYFKTAGNWYGKAEIAMTTVRAFVVQEVAK